MSRRIVLVLMLGVVLIQAAWIIAVPPFRGSDEVDHAFRAAGVGQDQWIAGKAPKDGRGLLVTVPESLVSAARPQCVGQGYEGRDNCFAVHRKGGGHVLIASSAGAYNPLFYAVPGIASRCCSGAASLYAMRVASALLCDVFLALAAWALSRWSRGPWPLTGLVVGMTPVFLYSTVVPAPNGIEMSAAVAFWCCLVGVDERGDPVLDRKLILAGIPAAAALVTVRTLGPLFLLIAVLAVVALRPRQLADILRRQRSALAGAVAVTAVATAASVLWIQSTGLLTPEPGAAQAFRPVQLLVVWTLQWVAAFPLRLDPAPPAVYALWLILMVGLVVAALRAGRRTAAARTLVGLLVLSQFLPMLLTLATMDGAGIQWQGRYGLPMVVGIFVLAGLLLDRHPPSSRRVTLVFRVGAVLGVAAHLFSIVHVLHHELHRRVSVPTPVGTRQTRRF